ncbi:MULTISPECIES: citrulline utilization hydrolase CtlX [Maribacter]|uniref:citrulline utilization hydrolase CtlX n=1 Tax=Maribacter TaxID=252356 RepID=UPI00047CE429|nr:MULTISPECIES: arginine deiminase-related protein [Maribacter]|eukprot:TRINITY_DN4917_c0_g1_i3.p2 TRINITY_DN4917_c0_g1~~TRINITY_DN4917_c0_g1_i3.p2  ORF type:complete len:310 (+),score=68.05 TRINITY_DN4917_c0_g1_i3:977-1906(+)
MQITNTILMIRPVSFRMNEQTAVNNYFMEDIDLKNQEINAQAQEEFDAFVSLLKSNGVNVIVVEDTKEPDTPDSIFPNNWISFHSNGTVGVYPMFAENRRNERREDILETLEENGFKIKDVIDYTSAEDEGLFLEGTGSILIDRVNKKAYCALSERANEDLFIEFCEDFDFFPVIFTANQSVDGKRLPIYHTNVMMALAEDFVVICTDSIDDKKERKNVLDHLKKDGKEVIIITEGQMHHFAGNMLQVLGADDKRYMVMSSAAYHSLRPEQVAQIENHCAILHSSLHTIETCGGGSARCMMAEVFLSKN